jgi:hypothetical protein
VIRAAATLVAAMLAAAAAAQEAPRAYPVPGRGQLELDVPREWYDEPRPRVGGLPTVRLFDRLGPRAPLELTLVIAWSTARPPSFADQGRLRAFVAQSADEVAPAAAEPRLDLRELEGANGIGYYFHATLKDPPAGEWPNLTRGAIVVGDLLVTFTIHAAEPAAPGVERALRMLKGARRVP